MNQRIATDKASASAPSASASASTSDPAPRKLVGRRQFLAGTLSAGAALGATALLPTACTFGGMRKRVKVAVLGAGLAGLRTAQLLEEQGVEYVVLEATDRAGGRTKAVRADGGYFNLGAVEVGDGYTRLLAQAQRFGIGVVEPWHSPSRDVALWIGGELLNSKDWARSAANRLPAKLRPIPPNALLYALHRDLPLKSLDDWRKSEFAYLDVPDSDYMRRFGADDLALRLADRAGNFNSLNKVSALHILRSLAVFRYGTSTKTLRVDGGSDLIPLAMAEALQRPVEYRQRVAAMRLTSNTEGVEIDCEDGCKWLAEKVVVTLPFSVLRQLQLDMPLPAAQGRAVAELPYTRISKFIYRVQRPFWEEDGLPASIWTDSPMERGFLERRPDGSINSYIIWVNGTGTAAVDSMPPQKAADWLLQQYAEIRPASKGALSPYLQYSWTGDRNALGAYHHFAPGQVGDFAHQMSEPVQGRVFFAGEHTATRDTGMEGAMESAERVLQQVLA